MFANELLCGEQEKSETARTETDLFRIMPRLFTISVAVVANFLQLLHLDVKRDCNFFLFFTFAMK